MTTFVLQGARKALPYIVNTAGRVALTYANAAINNAFDRRTFEGPRLESLHIQTSRDGAPMPRVFGRTRLAGQVIWASNFKETSNTSSAGGKGGGPKTRNYSYSISFAVGLCEGEIASVERLWANGENLKNSGLNYRVYTGSETQNPDPIISLIDGPDAPAFRGTAYIVFEDFPLDDYGARLPQINVEILRVPNRISEAPRLEDMIKGVDLIPGSGEFVYATQAIEDTSIPGQSRAININNLSGQADVKLALDQLQSALPNCKSVSIVTSWFGDDLRCGQCRLRPGTESRDRKSAPQEWRVGGADRGNAFLISRQDDKPVYGGTPSDQTLIDLIAELKSRDLKVSFYPFVLMDINPVIDQPSFPWRGRITANLSGDDQTRQAALNVDSFFGNCVPSDFTITGDGVNYSGPQEDSFRRMILHYAALCSAAGGVDSFIIGSEMRGLTTVRGQNLSYPAVAQFKQLAADVRVLVGPQTRLTYAADWSEYFGHHAGGNTVFHLDPLWSDPNIDAVGIDAYFPLSDTRGTGADAAPDVEVLTAAVEGGEGYDWYYQSPGDRDNKLRTPITDGAYKKPWVYRFKDIRNWWSRPHYNRIAGVEEATPTGWTPQSKPIWLTEVGCPAVDKGANQPNVFYDPKSSESFLPYFSSGQRSDLAQRNYLQALIEYWEPEAGHNPISDVYGGPMVDPDNIHAWCWDARPYPDFPARRDVWSDGPNWTLGHWLSGRLGTSMLGDVVYEIASRGGAADIDVTGLTGVVSGYALDRPMSSRAALEPLAQAYGFTCLETPAGLRFQMLGTGNTVELTADDIAISPQSPAAPVLSVRRTDAAQAPQDVRLHYIDIGRDYQRGMASAADQSAARDYVTDIEAPLVLDAGLAKSMTETLLARALTADHGLSFDIMPSAGDLKPGDVIRLPQNIGAGAGYYVIEGLDGLSVRSVTVQPLFAGGQSVQSGITPQALPAIGATPAPQFFMLDVPQLTAGENRRGPLVTAYSAPWSPVTASFAGDFAEIDTPAQFGTLLSDLPAGPVGRFHARGALHVSAPAAMLSSVTRAAMLSGRNALALRTDLGWEIIQFQSSDLIAPGEYRLSGLLRGQAGSDGVMQDMISAGAAIIILGQGLYTLPVDSALRGSVLDISVSARSRSDSRTETADYNAVHLIPLAPVHPRSRVLPDGSVHISWTRRTRLGGDDWAARDVPLGEDEERYAVDLLDGEVVVWSYEVTQPSLTLTPQILQGLNLPTIGGLTVIIRQISRLSGPGYPLRAEIKLSS